MKYKLKLKTTRRLAKQ